MTWRDTLEIGVKENARYCRDNLPVSEVTGPEVPQGPGRSPEMPGAQAARTVIAPEPDGLAQWQDEGGAAPTATQRAVEHARAIADAHTDEREAEEGRLDTGHDSASRGEHRYPAAQLTRSEQDARRERDALKRRLAPRPH